MARWYILSPTTVSAVWNKNLSQMAEGLTRGASGPIPAPSDEPDGAERAQAPGPGSVTTGGTLRQPQRRRNHQPLGLVASAVDDDCNLDADRGEECERDSLHRGDRREHVETAATGAAAGSGAPSSSVLEQGRADRDALAGQLDPAAGTLTPSCAD